MLSGPSRTLATVFTPGVGEVAHGVEEGARVCAPHPPGGVSGAAARRWSSLPWKVLWQPSCPRKSVSLVSPFGDVRSFELDAT